MFFNKWILYFTTFDSSLFINIKEIKEELLILKFMEGSLSPIKRVLILIIYKIHINFLFRHHLMYPSFDRYYDFFKGFSDKRNPLVESS